MAKIAAAEQERFSKKAAEVQEHSKHDSDSDKLLKPKSRKNDGEEKYEQIYSVSSSFGKFDLDFTRRDNAEKPSKFTSEPPTLPNSCFSVKQPPAGQKEDSIQ